MSRPSRTPPMFFDRSGLPLALTAKASKLQWTPRKIRLRAFSMIMPHTPSLKVRRWSGRTVPLLSCALSFSSSETKKMSVPSEFGGHGQVYSSSSPNHRPPAPSGGSCLVKIRRPIVVPRRFGKSRTFSASPLSTAWGERTGPICALRGRSSCRRAGRRHRSGWSWTSTVPPRRGR
jgi:hypothetical protein